MTRARRTALAVVAGLAAAAPPAHAQAPPVVEPVLPDLQPVLPLPGLGPSPLECIANREVVVFTAGLDINPFDGGERGGITIVRADGTGLRKITNFTTRAFNFSRVHGLNLSDDHPAFSPDGTRIVFTSERTGNDFDIHTMRPDGSDVRRVAAAPGLDTEPQFSPDGTQIAFATQRFAGGGLDIAVMNADGTNVRRLTSRAADEIEPAWRNDGRVLAFTRATSANDKEIFLIRSDGTGERQLTDVRREDHDAVFEPGGSTVLLTSERPFTSPPFGNTYRLDVNTGAPVIAGDAVDRDNGDLTDDLAFGAGDPAVSCDGSKIAFFKSRLATLGPMELFTMRKNGTGKLHIPVQGQVAVHPDFGQAADSDADGTPDYLESAAVGVARLRSSRTLPTDRLQRLVVDWTHPRRPWQDLDTLSFRLVDARGRLVSVVAFTQDDRTFSLFDRARRAFTLRERLPGDRRGPRARATHVDADPGAVRRAAVRARGGLLRAGAVTLDLRRTRIVDRSRRTVRLVLALRLARRAAGRLALQAQGTSDARDAHGAGDHEELGTIARLRAIG
jgi:hypothetical protein